MKNNFLTRTVSGILIAAIMVGAVVWSLYSLFFLAAVIMLISMYEFYRLAFPQEQNQSTEQQTDAVSADGNSFARAKRCRFGSLFPYLVALTLLYLVLGIVWGGLSAAWLMVLVPMVFLIFVAELSGRNIRPLQHIAVRIAGIVYIAVPMALLVSLGVETKEGVSVYDYTFVLSYIVLIWINDVGAYLVGRTFGRHKLCERLSPKKSWEGFWGGFVLTVLVSVGIGYFTKGDLLVWFLLGVVLSLSAVAGDLVESMFKREAGIKDSGNIIPGHGGFLDRFDAMFVSLPFVYVLVKLLA